MRTATYLVMGALGMACAHKPATPAATSEPAAPSDPTEIQVSTAPSDGSGDPRLGAIEQTSAPGARAEVVSEARSANESAQPRAIEPDAPTVATTPPGSALAPPSPRAASKEEADLRARVQRALMQDNSLSFTAKRVQVEVDRGRVTLLGGVRTAREKTEVEALVEKVSGVRRVHNRLAVIEEPIGRTPDL